MRNLILTLLALTLMAFTPAVPTKYASGSFTAQTLRTYEVNNVCKEKLGRALAYNRDYIGCYVPSEDLIVLPMHPPKWLIEHEEAHARGWRHK